MTRIFLLLILIGICTFSCRKEFERTETVQEIFPNPITRVKGALAGQVVDANGNGMENAKVVLNGTSVFTNFNGFFLLENQDLNADGTIVSAEKEGYFISANRFYPSPNSTSFTKIHLEKKILANVIDAESGGLILTDEGASIAIPANGIADENGALYSGPVHAFAKYIDPTEEKAIKIMPGDLVGFDLDGNLQSLQSYGTLMVEMESPNGNPLKLAQDAIAEVIVPLPESITNDAPQTLPIWYFDKDSQWGLWEEEGSANQSGRQYVAQVSDFTTWTFGIPAPLMKLNANVTTKDGTSLPTQSFRLLKDTGESVLTGYTDIKGDINGQLPINERLVLEFKDQCIGYIRVAEIGPYSQDLSSTNLTIEDDQLNQRVSISGQAFDCDGAPLQNAFVEVSNDGFQVIGITNAEGNYSVSLVDCGIALYNLQIFDLKNQLTSPWAPIFLSQAIDNKVNYPPITSCKQAVAEFMEIDLEGFQFYIPFVKMGLIRQNPLPGESDKITTVQGNTVRGNAEFVANLSMTELNGPGLQAKDQVFFDLSFLESTGILANANTFSTCFSTSGCEDINLNIEQYGGIGSIITGSFEGSGEWTSQAFNGKKEYSFTGRFQVIRE